MGSNFDLYSHVQVILSFEEPEVGLTVVKLTQTNVPDEDRYTIKNISFTENMVCVFRYFFIISLLPRRSGFFPLNADRIFYNCPF